MIYVSLEGPCQRQRQHQRSSLCFTPRTKQNRIRIHIRYLHCFLGLVSFLLFRFFSFLRPSLTKPKPRLFSRPNFPKPRLFSETKFSETETETSFPRPNFPKPKPTLFSRPNFLKPRLFFQHQILRNQNPQKVGKSLESKNFRNQNLGENFLKNCLL